MPWQRTVIYYIEHCAHTHLCGIYQWGCLCNTRNMASEDADTKTTSVQNSILPECVNMDWASQHWVRCSAAWSDIGTGNTLAIFHNITDGMYRFEIELAAETVDLVALVSELNFAYKWCPFVLTSRHHTNTQYILDNALVYELVLRPVAKFMLGLIVVDVKQTFSTDGTAFCIQCEDMHANTMQSHRVSYFAFDTFQIRFERDSAQHKTCCSFVIRARRMFAFMPAALLFVACREMFACFVKRWTSSAQLLRRNLYLYVYMISCTCTHVKSPHTRAGKRKPEGGHSWK